jgi:hypothetical protein
VKLEKASKVKPDSKNKDIDELTTHKRTWNWKSKQKVKKKTTSSIVVA